MKKKSLVKWGGFCNNKLDITKQQYNGFKIYALYPSKKTAKLCYKDVRKVVITLT